MTEEGTHITVEWVTAIRNTVLNDLGILGDFEVRLISE